MKINVTIRVIALAMVVVALSSCNNSDALDETKCLESVHRVYPNSKIYQSPNNKYTFIVIDSTGVREVRTTNMNNSDVSGITEYVHLK